MGSPQSAETISRNLHDDSGSELLPDDIIWDVVSRFLASPTVTNKEAIKLGLSSKTIFHVVQNRPNLIFDGSEVDDEDRYNQELDYMHAMLRKHNEDDIHLDNFIFKITEFNYDDPNSVHDECIDLAAKRRLKTLNLFTSIPGRHHDHYINSSVTRTLLPESVYEVESLVQIRLRGWNLDPTRAVTWPNLKQLCLDSVRMSSTVFEIMLRSCPLIENLEILDLGFLVWSWDSSFKVPNLQNLKQLTIQDRNVYSKTFEVSASPNLESIACSYLRENFTSPELNQIYQSLRTLSLDHCVGMDIDLLFTDSARQFPRLEELSIGNNPILEEISVQSPSLVKLRLVNLPSLKLASFVVPNILLFEFECCYKKIVGKGDILPKFSFIGNRKERTSRITLEGFPTLESHPRLRQELNKYKTRYLDGSTVFVHFL